MDYENFNDKHNMNLFILFYYYMLLSLSDIIYIIFLIIIILVFIKYCFPKYKIHNLVICIALVVWILFVNVNPYSLDNDNKYSILSHINPKYLPKNMGILTRDYVFTEPIVIKPTICSRCSKQVKIIQTKEDLNNYFSQNEDIKEMMYQTFVPYKNEVGILYERNIINNKGKIISIIKRDPRYIDIAQSCDPYDNKCVDSENLITQKLSSVICSIADSIPNFNAGRFDA